jgi:hypothetical protein
MQFTFAAFPPNAHPVAWNTAVAVCIIANIIWYRAKFLLKANGFTVSFILAWAEPPESLSSRSA